MGQAADGRSHPTPGVLPEVWNTYSKIKGSLQSGNVSFQCEGECDAELEVFQDAGGLYIQTKQTEKGPCLGYGPGGSLPPNSKP